MPWLQTSSRGLFLAASSICVLIMLGACSIGSEPEETRAVHLVSVNSDLWPRLLEQMPYPYTTPLPPAKATIVDGVYSKVDPRQGTRPFCKRCMPYPAEGGLWVLQLNQGVYRILSARSLNGWRSMGSFTVSGDQIALFNDPHCVETVGRYTWKLEAGQLTLAVLQDECADGWRGITFSSQAWEESVVTSE